MRKLSERFGVTVDKMKSNIVSKCILKKKKKRKTEDNKDEEPNIPISMFVNNVEVSLDNTVSEVFVQGAELVIDDQKLTVEVNVPNITAIKLPSLAIAGYPVFPDIEFEFADVELFDFQWFKIDSKYITIKKSNGKAGLTQGITEKHYTPLMTTHDRFYTPCVDDIGYNLILRCTPRDHHRTGEMFEAASKTCVIEGPGHCIFEDRQQFTSTVLAGSSFRVMSYNMLADVFADTEYTRTTLYPYCKPEALVFDYRKSLLIKEISGYNTDIMCMQEVDEKHYLRTFVPQLELQGFEGAYKGKTGNMKEGEAIFFRTAKFKQVADCSIAIRDVLATDSEYSKLAEQLQKTEDLWTLIQNLGTILQVIILECQNNPKQKLLVANTHLYFRPSADHVRLIQGMVCVQHIAKLLKSYKDNGIDITSIFCGDFNSDPKSVLHSFMTTGIIQGDSIDIKIPEHENCLAGATFDHKETFKSACGYPEYTNYVGNFHEQLDYVFIDPAVLTVDRVIPPPTNEQITSHTGLPSQVYPSDHIAQICDITWL